jgi:hypothetical protein
LVGDVARTGNRILALDLGEAVEVDASELGGINIWLLETAARLGNFTVKYEVWRPADSVNDRALQTIQALERGYDCVVTSVIHSYERCGEGRRAACLPSTAASRKGGTRMGRVTGLSPVHCVEPLIAGTSTCTSSRPTCHTVRHACAAIVSNHPPIIYLWNPAL